MALNSPDTHAKVIAFINTHFATDKVLMQNVFQLAMSPWWDVLTKGNAVVDIDLMKKYALSQFVALPIEPKWTGADGDESIAADVSRSLAINGQKLLAVELHSPTGITLEMIYSCVADPIIVAAYSVQSGTGMGNLINNLYILLQELDTE